jgi:precorrin-6B methylase 2
MENLNNENDDVMVVREIFADRLELENALPIWNKIWNKNALLKDVFNHELFLKVHSILQKRLKPLHDTASILILGQKAGGYAIKIARQYPKSNVVFVSTDKASLEPTKTVTGQFDIKNLSIVEEDIAKQTSLKENSFDFIFVDASTKFSVPLPEILKRASTLLKSGNPLNIMAINSSATFHNIQKIIAEKGFDYKPEVTYSRKELVDALRGAGLEMRDIGGFYLKHDSYYMKEPGKIKALIGSLFDKSFAFLEKVSSKRMSAHSGMGFLVSAKKPVDIN